MSEVQIFSAVAAFVLYVLIGYPCLVMLWAHWFPRPVKRAEMSPTVSVLMPARNGGAWLEAKLHSLLDLRYPRKLVEILVISDGSSDDTDTIASSFADRGVRLLRVPPGGKALALNAGRKVATGEILFLTDVRQKLHPDSLQALVDCFADPTVGAVSGELFIADGQSEAEANTGLYWKYEKRIRKAQSAVASIPGATGCIYAIRSRLAVDLPAGVLDDDVYLPLAAYFQGFRLILEPGARAYDRPSSLNTEFHRKVRTLAGIYQVIGAYPRLLWPNHPLWFHFLSHKLARLLLPWALLVLFVSAIGLPMPWRAIALGPQLAFYGLAALDSVLPEGNDLKRLASVARTFVVLMLASACAVSILFRSGTTLWKPSSIQPSTPER